MRQSARTHTLSLLLCFSWLGGIAFLTGCHDADGPRAIAGAYVMDGFYETTLPLGPPQPPFGDPTQVIDSLKDTLTLHADLTYKESGTAWRRSLLTGTPEGFPIQAEGRYTLDGSVVTLTPDYGATIGGGSGTVEKGVVLLERYPGVWRFRR